MLKDNPDVMIVCMLCAAKMSVADAQAGFGTPEIKALSNKEWGQ
jgi:hypothetical protein